MLLVIERDRLAGFQALAEADEEGEQENPYRQSNEEELHPVDSFLRLCLVR